MASGMRSDDRTDAAQRRLYGLGIGAVLMAAVCASIAGILVRGIESADAWQILFFRALAFTATIFSLVLIRHGRATPAAFLAIGRSGLVLALALGLAFIAFIFALTLTAVADVVLILATSPLIAAVISRVVLGEAIGGTTLAAMAVALIGVVIMVAGESQTARPIAGDRLTGMLVAFGACLGYAVSIVALRAGRAVDMMPATCLSGVVALVITSLLVGSLAVPARDIGLALLLGTAQLGGQYALITYASRVVPAGQIALVMLLEVVLAPLWVWIGVGEVPGGAVLLGGGVVLAGLLLQSTGSLRRAAVEQA